MKQIAHRLGYAVTFMAKWNHDAARVERPHASVALEGRARTPSTTPARPQQAERARAALPRRPARADARAHRALFADRQQLQALRARRVGAAQRELGRREPHLRHPRHPGEREVHARSSTGRRPRTSTRTSRWRRPSRRASGASSSGASRRRRSTGDASAREAISPPLPRTLREATGAARRRASTRARLLGEAFVDHYVRTRDWECASTSAPSPSGSSSATSRAM